MLEEDWGSDYINDIKEETAKKLNNKNKNSNTKLIIGEGGFGKVRFALSLLNANEKI